MNILELVKQLDVIKRDYKRQLEDLPKSYVRGSKVFEEAKTQVRDNYEKSKSAILEQINQELVKIEAKAETEQKFYRSLSEPTLEDIAEGYKVIDVITKTANMLSPATLENLLLKVKDMDQLAVITDVINSLGDLDLKMAVKQRIIDLDTFDAERRNTMQLIEDFKKAMAVSGDSMTFTVMNLASQLAEV